MEKRNTNRRTGDTIPIDGDYQYNAFYNGSAPQRFWHRFKLTTAIRNLQPEPGAHILDAGCGSGMLAALVAMDNPGISTTGLDGNSLAITFCRRQWRHLPNARFLEGPIDELHRFPNSSFDGIAFLEVIEHLTAEQAAHVLTEFHRILRTGGRLVISTPNRKSLWPLLEMIMDTLRLAPTMHHHQHEHLYSGRELQQLALQSGFTPALCQHINFLAPWIATVSEKWAMKMHSWEAARQGLPGSLLLYTFTK
jgi:2-polyprenyl-3-methyl-5-hydroxy-6-metoxy-1,4-benzoquinol methylase